MTMYKPALLAALTVTLAACGGAGDGANDAQATSSDAAQRADTSAAVEGAATADEAGSTADWTEIAPGLSMRTLVDGSGEVAASGQVATVHYTGWLHDPSAADGRGDKFDSSVDRDQYFEFPLGAGQVIQGWDQGVVGMQVGETRELLIAPEMAYGDRQVGNLIPPGSTLLFEVELAGLDGDIPNPQ